MLAGSRVQWMYEMVKGWGWGWLVMYDLYNIVIAI